MRYLCQFIYLFPDLDVFTAPWFPEIHFSATLFICVLKATMERGDFVCISVIFQPFTGYNWMYVNLLRKSRVLVRSIHLLILCVLYICPYFLCKVPSYHYIRCFSFDFGQALIIFLVSFTQVSFWITKQVDLVVFCIVFVWITRGVYSLLLFFVGFPRLLCVTP